MEPLKKEKTKKKKKENTDMEFMRKHFINLKTQDKWKQELYIWLKVYYRSVNLLILVVWSCL